ncbi:MAG: hypothetical protein O3B95_05230 [Chloroflexi bacterium]|nr:hypothetical protein [Chloroflexota bacterium]
MARTSQWADNPEMWEHVAQLRKGGMKYSDIRGRLAGRDRVLFGLEEVPTEDVIRYNLKKRSLLGIHPSPLPPDELEEHYQALTYIGNVLRHKIQSPTDRGVRFSNWQGFEVGKGVWPDPKTEAEEEVSWEWEDNDSGPEAFTLYVYFRKHMDSTLLGRKVNNALDAVKRTTTDYKAERTKLRKVVALAIHKAFPDVDNEQKKDLFTTVFSGIRPTTKNPGHRPARSIRLPEKETELTKRRNEAIEHLKSSGANTEIAKNFKKLITAQTNLEAALKPSTLVRRLVQDSECELCSSKPLERAK